MLPGEGNLAQRQRAGKRVSNNWRTGGWGASGSQGWEEGVKESGLVPPALLSPNLGGEDSLPWLGTLWSRPPPPPASGTAGDWGQPDAPSGTLLGQARAHTPLSLLALPLPSLSLSRPSSPSLALHRLPSGAVLAPTCSEALSALGRSQFSAPARRPNRRSLRRQRALGVAASTHPSFLPRYDSGALDVRPSPLSPRMASRPW